MKKDTEDLTVLPIIKYEYTVDTAKALVAASPKIPEFDPSLGKTDPINSDIIRHSKFWNKVESTREKIRKQTKQPGLDFCREVDAKSKELSEIFEPKKIEWAAARKQVEDYGKEQEQKRIDAERARVEAIGHAITRMQMIPSGAIGMKSGGLTEIYEGIEIPTETEYQERYEEAIITYKDTMSKLETMIGQAKSVEEAEAIQAEAAKKQAEIQAKQQAEQQAEREAFEEEKRIFEEEKQKAKEREEAEALKLAEARAEQFAKEQVEAKLLEQDETEQRAIERFNSTALIIAEYIKCSPEQAKDLLAAIQHGKIEGVTYE